MAKQKIEGMTPAEMLELRKQGITLREIGEKFGVSRQRIQQILGNTRDIKPKKTKPRPRTPEDKFWARIEVAGFFDCWNWSGSKHPITGYGLFCRRGKHEYAHRVAYILNYGEIPDGKHVLHSCDNPACCNPVHLRVGNAQDNANDRELRCRSNRGRKSGEYYAWRIRHLQNNCKSLSDIRGAAKKFGVSAAALYFQLLRARKGSANVST